MLYGVLASRLALTSGRASPPTNRSDSRPLSTPGVIAQVPPHAADAIVSAVSVPPNGSVKPLVRAPTTQKPVFSGA